MTIKRQMIAFLAVWIPVVVLHGVIAYHLELSMWQMFLNLAILWIATRILSNIALRIYYNAKKRRG